MKLSCGCGACGGKRKPSRSKHHHTGCGCQKCQRSLCGPRPMPTCKIQPIYYQTPCGLVYVGPADPRERYRCGPPPPCFYLPEADGTGNQYIRMLQQLQAAQFKR